VLTSNHVRIALLGAVLLGAALGPLSGRARASARVDEAFFGADKSLHFSISAAAALTCELALNSFQLPASLHYPLALALPLGLGFGKELLDYARGGQASRADLTWDILGVATGVLVAFVLEKWLIGSADAAAPTARAAISSW
jgi:putative lipoprotein